MKMLLPLNIQFFAGKKTIYELKQAMATIGQQLAKTEEDLATKAMDPSASLDDIKTVQTSKADLQARFDVIKAQHDQLEDEQKAKFAQNPLAQIDDPKQKRTEAFASLVRSTVRNQPIDQEIYAALGDNTNPATGGEKFLPKTVSQEIITEPMAKNPMRDLVTVTNIPNLEIPKLAYTIDDDNFIADTETAKELELEGSTVTFGRFKSKVFAGVSETVLAGTHTNLVSHVENSLRSGLAAKEKKVQFATSPKAGEEHMSFYQTGANAIKKVSGEDLYKAIKAAIADLHEDYRENAKIVMTFADYSTIIETLANGNATLYAAQPEQILGKPVVFVDAATKPIIGDFSYAHLNYDLNVLYDTDKDVKTGVNAFVLTAWFDHRIKLKSAFRIADVVATP
ncbi:MULTISPECIES: phage major capsid protein [unclassified Lysinibacillus]|uniref:phage major capsid protein n=1 Tax=unclassified Lysinibacillus TaxID=2636778 RepID=UPI0038181F81